MKRNVSEFKIKIKSIVVIGVNFNSYLYAKEFVIKWSAIPHVTDVWIIDNFSSYQERDRIRSLSEYDKVTVIELDNHGYGASLNFALKNVSRIDSVNNSLILLGNVDVIPIDIGLEVINEGYVPQIDVIERGRNRNPFLTVLQKQFLFLYIIAAKFKLPFLLILSIYFNRLLSFIPSKTWAVHGSFFALPGRLIGEFDSTFSPDVFLYCEELFFANRVEKLGYKFQRSHIKVEHIGAVSTGKTIKKDKDKFFNNWCSSMMKYSGVCRLL